METTATEAAGAAETAVAPGMAAAVRRDAVPTVRRMRFTWLLLSDSESSARI
jgi:hypothetical protein